MKTALRNTILALGTMTILVGTLLSNPAFAACGNTAKYRPGAWLLPQSLDKSLALLLPVSAKASDAPIVGMWHVTFTAEGNEAGPPDGAPIDNALVTWHSDGTEIMASDRPPQDGNFCMGVVGEDGQGQIQGQSHSLAE